MPHNQINSSNLSAQESSDFEVKTMPKKFFSAHLVASTNKSQKAKHKKVTGIKKNLIIGLVVIIVLGLLMALAAWFFLRSVDKDKVQAPKNMAPVVNNLDQKKKLEATQPKAKPAVDILDTALWLSFEDIPYNYTFKYPSTWEAKQQDQASKQPNNGVLQVTNLVDQEEKGIIKITVFDNSQESLELIEWIQITQFLSSSDLELFTLDNRNSYKYKDTLGKVDIIYTLSQDKIYTISFAQQEEKLFDKVYTQFLNNFKFTKEEVPEVIDEEPPVIIPTVDTDKDNLTDLEESIFKTDKNKRDTDNDSYIDGDEVANLYDPNMSGPSRLYDSEIVTTYVNQSFNYNLIYPSVWKRQGDKESVILQDADGEFIQILVTTNQDKYPTIKDWYKATINTDISNLTNLTIDSAPAVRTPDGMRAYVLIGDNIYNLIYNIGLRNEANFMTTFDMIIKSFKVMQSMDQ